MSFPFQSVRNFLDEIVCLSLSAQESVIAAANSDSQTTKTTRSHMHGGLPPLFFSLSFLLVSSSLSISPRLIYSLSLSLSLLYFPLSTSLSLFLLSAFLSLCFSSASPLSASSPSTSPPFASPPLYFPLSLPLSASPSLCFPLSASLLSYRFGQCPVYLNYLQFTYIYDSKDIPSTLSFVSTHG